MGFVSSATALVPAPRRAVLELIGPEPLRPVPLAPRQVGLFVSHHSWSETPVGPFEEVVVAALVYRGRGSPIPGLAPLLHATLGTSDAVGEFGIAPLQVIVDRPGAADLRRDLWQVPTAIERIRTARTEDTATIQVEHRDDACLRLVVAARPSRRDTVTTSLPLYAVGTAEDPWQDLVQHTASGHRRRLRPGGGHVALYPVADLTRLVGPLGGSGAFRRSTYGGELTGPGVARYAGPRQPRNHPPLLPADASSGAAHD